MEPTAANRDAGRGVRGLEQTPITYRAYDPENRDAMKALEKEMNTTLVNSIAIVLAASPRLNELYRREGVNVVIADNIYSAWKERTGQTLDPEKTRGLVGFTDTPIDANNRSLGSTIVVDRSNFIPDALGTPLAKLISVFNHELQHLGQVDEHPPIGKLWKQTARGSAGREVEAFKNQHRDISEIITKLNSVLDKQSVVTKRDVSSLEMMLPRLEGSYNRYCREAGITPESLNQE